MRPMDTRRRLMYALWEVQKDKRENKQWLKHTKFEQRNEYTNTRSSIYFKWDKPKETQTEIQYNQTLKNQRQT